MATAENPIPSLVDVIVIGSGPGSATVARELARKGYSVAVLEWGSAAPLKGTLAQMAGIAAIPFKGMFIEPDASLLLRGITAGGSSAINYATAMPPPFDSFRRYGIELESHYSALQQDIPIQPLPDELIGPMASRLMHSAQQLGLSWHKLDKMIAPELCRSGCWRCTYGCPFGAKWTARMFLDDAVAADARLISNAKVSRVLIKEKRAIGVEFKHQGKIQQINSDKVVLAAGGIGTPQILAASGIKNVGRNFFVDPVVAVMGSIKDMQGGREVPMATGLQLQGEGIMLADMTLPKPLFQGFATQAGRVDRLFSHSSTLTLMVKIRDQLGGHFNQLGPVKSLTLQDKEKFKRGIFLARDILGNAGASSIFSSWHFAAHPGGTAKLGEIVDNKLQTEVDGLHVCDASVIPEEWGLPPTVTLLCLGKHLSEVMY